MNKDSGSDGQHTETSLIASTQQASEGGDEVELSPLLSYLSTDFGHAVVMKLLGLIEDIKKATVDKNSEQGAKQLELHHKSLMRWWVVQTVILVSALLSVAALAWHGKLDATVAALIGTIVGFVFGRKQ